MHRKREITFPKDGNSYFRLKLSGNMPAGRALQPSIPGGIRLFHPMLTGIMENDANKQSMLVNTRLILGAFLICMEMFGSGHPTGMPHLPQWIESILKDPLSETVREVVDKRLSRRFIYSWVRIAEVQLPARS